MHAASLEEIQCRNSPAMGRDGRGLLATQQRLDFVVRLSHHFNIVGYIVGITLTTVLFLPIIGIAWMAVGLHKAQLDALTKHRQRRTEPTRSNEVTPVRI